MSEHLDWTTDLGDAEVNQPQDVADVIQELRAEAEAGALKTTARQVQTGAASAAQDGTSYITIQPSDPSRVCVPTYDPVAVYQPTTTSVVAPLLTFSAGVAVGAPLKLAE